MDKLLAKDGKEIAVTADGSLGLLALGYRGLIAWRQKRMEEHKKLQTPTPGSKPHTDNTKL
jgi:hypothetical protein